MHNLLAATINDVMIPRTHLSSNTVQNAIAFMLQLAGAIALVYVVIGAIRFTTSSGDPQAVAAARKTVIYSSVGLVVAVLGLAISSLVQGFARRASESGNPFFGSDGIITILVDQLSFVVGVAAVIMIVVGGIRYITSAGQPQSAQAARNTIVYALIGLVVAALGQTIVRFVLQQL